VLKNNKEPFAQLYGNTKVGAVCHSLFLPQIKKEPPDNSDDSNIFDYRLTT
jgi:hypothetical protein